jgi:hypothetical protein
MNITIKEDARIICSNPNGIHNYFGWPSVARLQDGSLMAVASGFRIAHVCPFGKVVAFRSYDEGKSWTNHVVIESEPDHGYCYTAMLFLGKNELLLEYCCGGGGEGQIPLYDSRLRVLDLDRLNGETE